MNKVYTTYLLALEVVPMAVGQAYSQLPMHCTIMHRFHSVLSATALVAALQPIIRAAQPVNLLPLKHQAFGPKKQLVTMVMCEPALFEFHCQLYDKLNSLGVHYTESDWVGTSYTPHVTDKHGKRLTALGPTVSGAVYIISVEHPLKGSQRFVEAKIALVGETGDRS